MQFRVNAFKGTALYEYIDGKSKHEILPTLQKMVMAVAAYKGKDMSGSHTTAVAYGFTGQLKSWWDNFITMQQKLEILSHSYKIKRENDMTKTIVKDGHDVLISTITHHFLDPKQYQTATKSILINLKCPCLSDYHWCKDVFLSNVFKKR